MRKAFYKYTIFIHPDSDAGIATFKDKLFAFYENTEIKDKPTIELDGLNLIIAFSDRYSFYLKLNDEDYVNEEAKEFANELKLDWNEEPFDAEKLRNCQKRFEMHGDPDFDMDYFNDSLFILEQIEDFSEIIIFDIN